MLRPERCENCPFKGRTVGARGNPLAPVLLVGESPGRDEQREGVPFIGKSGKILFSALPSEYNTEKDFFITNAMKCHPPKHKKKKDPHCIARGARTCNESLIAEVNKAPRDIIIAMGNAALWSLTNDYSLKITKIRGQLIESPLAKIGILPVVHPAALLHGTGTYTEFKSDLRYAFDLFEGEHPKTSIKPSIVFCDTIDKIRAAVKVLRKQKLLAADAETSGFSQFKDYILCLGIAYKPEEVFIFPGSVVHMLRKLFRTKGIEWLWHNGKFDVGFLRRRKLHAKVHQDTMLLSYALNEYPGYHALEQLSANLLGAPNYKDMVKQYLKKKNNNSYADVPRDILYEYLSYDVSNTLQIYPILREQVSNDKHLEKLYTKILIPASEFLSHIEREGIPVDPEQIEKVKETLTKECDVAEKQLQEIAKTNINPRSPQQVATLLYDKLALKKVKGRGTGKKILKLLPQDHPVIKSLQTYRVKHKALSSYITGKKQGIEQNIQADGRVHATYKLHATRTGRLACEAPNNQNIPRDKDIRNIYVAPKGYRVVEIDLNQAELRSLAILSGDEFLCGIYNSSDRSLHHEVAVEMFGKDYTPEEKMRAKAVNFGIIYGREAPSLAEEFKIAIEEATRYIRVWFKRMPRAEKFINFCRSTPKTRKTLITCFGRKKRHHLVTDESLRALQNEAANFPHQSIASDITLLTGIEVRDYLIRKGVRTINIIHDSLLLLIPDNDQLVDEIIAYVSKVMERIPRDWGLTRVPFKAEAKEGYRWGDLKDVKRERLAA